MLITEFPNSKYARISFAEFTEKLGKENIIVMGSHNYLFTKFENAPLSLKTTIRGRETYLFDQVETPVDADTFLLLNKGRTYKSIIDSDFAIRSLSLFFKFDIAEKVLAAMKRNHTENLDQPDKACTECIFIEKLIDKKGPVCDMLMQLQHSLPVLNGNQLMIDELFCDFIEAILQEHFLLSERIDNLSATKPSTRREIYRRLSKARRFIHANYQGDFSLKDLSMVACMSEYHFLRMFKAYHSVTPFQYLTTRRVIKAKEYLRVTEYPVHIICRKVGYSDESSFSRVFKKKTGISPSQFRLAQK